MDIFLQVVVSGLATGGVHVLGHDPYDLVPRNLPARTP